MIQILPGDLPIQLGRLTGENVVRTYLAPEDFLNPEGIATVLRNRICATPASVEAFEYRFVGSIGDEAALVEVLFTVKGESEAVSENLAPVLSGSTV